MSSTFENNNIFRGHDGAWRMVSTLNVRPAGAKPGSNHWAVIVHAHPSAGSYSVPTAWVPARFGSCTEPSPARGRSSSSSPHAGRGGLPQSGAHDDPRRRVSPRASEGSRRRARLRGRARRGDRRGGVRPRERRRRGADRTGMHALRAGRMPPRPPIPRWGGGSMSEPRTEAGCLTARCGPLTRPGEMIAAIWVRTFRRAQAEG